MKISLNLKTKPTDTSLSIRNSAFIDKLEGVYYQENKEFVISNPSNELKKLAYDWITLLTWAEEGTLEFMDRYKEKEYIVTYVDDEGKEYTLFPIMAVADEILFRVK